jgi:4-diphosphocytidyl-2-C-methyl-D-erythritol kinase
LHVTGRRADGYHLLETVFELIDLSDTIDLMLDPSGQIRRETRLDGVEEDADLTVRAARLLAADSGCSLGVRIGLTKRIPMGGGLGGGSSDAATVLMGLNRLWNLHWPADRLAALGVRLGADVPVFIGGRTAYATGIGEVLEPIDLPLRHYVVVAPGVHVPTVEIFSAPELTRNSKPLTIDGLSRGCRVFCGRNDLQPVVFGRYPQVAYALDLLADAARQSGVDPGSVRMSGSGACVFLPVEDAADGDGASQARRVAARLSQHTWMQVIVCRSLRFHPLCE